MAVEEKSVQHCFSPRNEKKKKMVDLKSQSESKED